MCIPALDRPESRHERRQGKVGADSFSSVRMTQKSLQMKDMDRKHGRQTVNIFHTDPHFMPYIGPKVLQSGFGVKF